jgi:hypothetical protein
MHLWNATLCKGSEGRAGYVDVLLQWVGNKVNHQVP